MANPSTPSPSPTPGVVLSATSTHDLPQWHFPGPSSVYHKREKERPRHRRFESTYAPVAPALSTEKRAQHRRTRSSAFFGATSPLLTPTGSEKSRSPLSRMASYSSTMDVPVTPARSMLSSRQSSKLQDSPFSDYFTDDGRSAENVAGEWYSAPSPEAQQLLLRLNKIQSQLMRGAEGESERETLNIVGKRLDNIDLELNALHSQTRNPAEMEDSGLFMEDEEEGNGQAESGTPNGLGMQYDGATDVFTAPVTKEEKRAEYDYLLAQAQHVLSNVSNAQRRLKQRHAELRELNDEHAASMDDRDRQIEELKSENEAMKLDLGHDHSELLFLKLQHKALEVEFDGLDDQQPREMRALQRKKLQDEMDRWRHDWDNVDGRMRRRRRDFRVFSPKVRRDSLTQDDDEKGVAAEDDGWRLETVKQAEKGRVESILIRRTTNALPSSSDESEADTEAGAEKPQPEEAPAIEIQEATQEKAMLSYADRSTQTDNSPLPWLLDPAHDTDADPGLEDHDCAITTSSENSDSELGNAEEAKPATPVKVVKTAWQALWEDLSSLAGMSEDIFD